MRIFRSVVLILLVVVFDAGQCRIVRLTGQDAIKLLTLHTALMRTSVSLYHRLRFPAEIISHCVWLYFRFALSFRDVEEMLAMRGVILTYETVREWCLKFGQTYANDLRRRSPRPGQETPKGGSVRISVGASLCGRPCPYSRRNGAPTEGRPSSFLKLGRYSIGGRDP